MHFDFAHAAVAVILIYMTLTVLKMFGISKQKKDGHFHWDWRIFMAIFVVMFVFNVIWPYG